MEIVTKEIMIASKNKNKIKEIKNIISGDVVLKSFMDYPDIPDVLEDGKTIEENSMKKAVEVARFTGLYSIADDTGLFVQVLGGEPGVYSARWAGEGCTYADNNRKLLNALKNVEFKDRKAVFKCAITIASPDGDTHTEVGEIEGYIAENLRGENGFGYDPVFYVPALDKTLAEMDFETKNKISHRRKALELIKPYLERVIYYGRI